MSFELSRENNKSEHVPLSVKQWLLSTTFQMLSLSIASGFMECILMHIHISSSDHLSFYVSSSFFISTIMITTIVIACIHAANNMSNPSARDLSNRFDTAAVTSYLLFMMGCVSFMICWFNNMLTLYDDIDDSEFRFYRTISMIILIFGFVVCFRTAYVSQQKPIECDEKQKQQ